MNGQNESIEKVSENCQCTFITNAFKSLHREINKVDDLNLSANLRRLRLDRGLSQIALAKISGVTSASICRMEQGKQKNVQLDKLVAISNALGCKFFELLS